MVTEPSDPIVKLTPSHTRMALQAHSLSRTAQTERTAINGTEARA